MAIASPSFTQLNHGWNAEPNAPEPQVECCGDDLLLDFFVNPFRFKQFKEEDRGMLRFVRCMRYRLGPTNDEGWYRDKCRYSRLAPSWGEFYESKYPPAEPGALGCEPLEAADGVADAAPISVGHLKVARQRQRFICSRRLSSSSCFLM